MISSCLKRRNEIVIKVTNDGRVRIEIEGQEYSIEDDESYKTLLVLLTSPDPGVVFKKDAFNCDPSIVDPALKEIAERYSAFFKSFIETRTELISANKSAIASGEGAVEEAIDLLAGSGELQSPPDSTDEGLGECEGSDIPVP